MKNKTKALLFAFSIGCVLMLSAYTSTYTGAQVESAIGYALGLGVDVSTYEGLVGVTGSATYEVNTPAELETAASLPAILSVTVAQSDCSTISSGWCRDTDDNILYYWDGDSVESMGGGDVATHESTYDHDAYDTHTSNTSNPHSVDAEDILEGASPSVTLAGGDIDGSATAWTLPPDGPENLLFSALSDSTSPHNLTENETIDAILTNYGASADAVLDFEDIPIQDGRDFCVIVEAAYQITIEPDTGENWYLNGTQCGADDAIFNDDDTVGETVCCISTANNMFCVSQDANWECE
jgi:hypothetical protein